MNLEDMHTICFAGNIEQTKKKKKNSYNTYSYNFRLRTLFTLLQEEKTSEKFLEFFPLRM